MGLNPALTAWNKESPLGPYLAVGRSYGKAWPGSPKARSEAAADVASSGTRSNCGGGWKPLCCMRCALGAPALGGEAPYQQSIACSLPPPALLYYVVSTIHCLFHIQYCMLLIVYGIHFIIYPMLGIAPFIPPFRMEHLGLV